MLPASKSPADPGRFFASPRRARLTALAAGALMPLAYAPFGLFPLAVLLPAALFALWLQASPIEAARRGYLFGLGMFGAGVSWIYFSLHDFGNMPAPLALAMVFILVGFLAIYPALLGYAQARVPGVRLRLLVFVPAAWVWLEWVRGWLFTGFPWLNLGYSQIDGPLAGLAPVFGVYGVSWAVALSAGLLVLLLRGRREMLRFAPLLLLLWGAAAALNTVAWTRPVDGPLQASLVQANVPIELKWQPAWRDRILARYEALSLAQPGSRLIIWPETAAPAYWHELPPRFLGGLRERAAAQGSTVVFGVVERRAGNPHPRLYNSVVALTEEPAFYRKRHLVPFGEYLPLSSMLSWLLDYMHIPMSDFDVGPAEQAPLAAAGQKLGVSVCYEAVFGEEVIRALPEATLLVNVSEDAWFGNSLAPHQHLQKARMRARETGRFLLRATNTGISAIVDARGLVIASAPQFETHVVTAAVQPMEGATPYVRLGNLPVVLLGTLIAGLVLFRRGRGASA